MIECGVYDSVCNLAMIPLGWLMFMAVVWVSDILFWVATRTVAFVCRHILS